MKNFDANAEISTITAFLKKTLSTTQKKKVVINWSGGIDSTVSLYLLAKILPTEAITVLHLPYEQSFEDEFLPIADYMRMTKSQFHVVSIKPMVEVIQSTLKVSDPFRLGNMMARVRMIVAYDYAKKLGALVCGTENRTEHLLGYFTRFGDGASDLEPIQHIYKTDVFALGAELRIPSNILEATPSAGLWSGQTDEGEFGFSYKEADEVLSRHYDDKKAVNEIEKEGFLNAKRILEFSAKNSFKHEVPYCI